MPKINIKVIIIPKDSEKYKKTIVHYKNARINLDYLRYKGEPTA
jgi:hypothetical protein